MQGWCMIMDLNGTIHINMHKKTCIIFTDTANLTKFAVFVKI